MYGVVNEMMQVVFLSKDFATCSVKAEELCSKSKNKIFVISFVCGYESKASYIDGSRVSDEFGGLDEIL